MSEDLDSVRSQLRARLRVAHSRGDWDAFRAAARELFELLAAAGGVAAATELDLAILLELVDRWRDGGQLDDASAALEVARVIVRNIRPELGPRVELMSAALHADRLDLDAAKRSLVAGLAADPSRDESAALRACAELKGRTVLEAADLRALAFTTLATWAESQGSYALASSALSGAIDLAVQGTAKAYDVNELVLLRAQARLDGGLSSALEGTRLDDPRSLLLAASDHALRGRLSEAEKMLAELQRSAPELAVNATITRAQVLIRLNRLADAEEALSGSDTAASEITLALASARRGGVTALLSLSANDLLRVLHDDAPASEISYGLDPSTRQHRTFAAELSERCQVILLMLHGAIDLTDDHGTALIQRAEEILRPVEVLAWDSDGPLVRARARQARALVEYRAGRWDSARSHAHAAASEFLCADAPLEASSALQIAEWASARLGDGAGAARAREQVEVLAERVRETLDAADRNFFGLNRWTQEDESLANISTVVAMSIADAPAREARDRVAEAIASIDRRRRWSAAQSSDPVRREDAEGIVDAAAALRAVAGFDDEVDVLRAGMLPADTAVARYVVLPDRIEILLLTSEAGFVSPSAPKSSRVALRDALRAFYDWVTTAPTWDRNARPLRKLAEVLGLGWLLPTVPESVRRLWIVPDDLVVQVPFGALPALDGRPLSARFETAIVPSCVFGAPDQRPRQRRFVGVAAATSVDQKLAPLAQVGDELGRVRGLYRKVTCLEGELATRSAVRAALEGARIAHFACHGHFDPKRLDESGLLVHDGWLDCFELAATDLSGLDTLVLASCWSAGAATLPGREIIGLPTVLLRSGAREVVASLIEVDDVASPEFSEELHRQLRSRSGAGALARTQTLWWERELPPREWAAQVVLRHGVAPSWWATPWTELRRTWRHILRRARRRSTTNMRLIGT